jgi:hypothetical protein
VSLDAFLASHRAGHTHLVALHLVALREISTVSLCEIQMVAFSDSSANVRLWALLATRTSFGIDWNGIDVMKMTKTYQQNPE